MPLIVIGLSHHSSPVTVRERFAFPDATIPAALEKLRQTGIVTEAVILSTCNRVEIYAATELAERQAMLELRQFLLDHHHYREPIQDEIYSHGEAESLEHLFKVACGLDSMVLGETEILGQLKEGLRDRPATQAHGPPSEQGLPKSVQRRQTNPHGNQHPARQRLRRLRRGRTGARRFSVRWTSTRS